MTTYTRLIRTAYHGGADGVNGNSRSLTLEGAVRAAIIRIAHGQYDSCEIHDERFGTKNTLALSIVIHALGIDIKWKKYPKWSNGT